MRGTSLSRFATPIQQRTRNGTTRYVPGIGQGAGPCGSRVRIARGSTLVTFRPPCAAVSGDESQRPCAASFPTSDLSITSRHCGRSDSSATSSAILAHSRARRVRRAGLGRGSTEQAGTPAADATDARAVSSSWRRNSPDVRTLVGGAHCRLGLLHGGHGAMRVQQVSRRACRAPLGRAGGACRSGTSTSGTGGAEESPLAVYIRACIAVDLRARADVRVYLYFVSPPSCVGRVM